MKTCPEHWHTVPLVADWMDYNGHLRDAFYGLAFSYAVDDFMIAIGIDEPYRQTTGGTLYVVEDHKHYLSEVSAGAGHVLVRTDVVARDAKRLHLYQRLYTPGTDTPAAVCEALHLHVVQQPAPRVVAIPDDICRRIDEFLHVTPEPRAGAINV